MTEVSRPPEYARTTFFMSGIGMFCLSRWASSVDFDAELFDHGCPFLRFPLDQIAEVLGRAADEVEAEPVHSLHDVRHLEDRVDLGIESGNDRLRRTGGH